MAIVSVTGVDFEIENELIEGYRCCDLLGSFDLVFLIECDVE